MKNVLYACNDVFAEQTIISIVSLLRHNAYPIKIWIVSDHISEQNKTLIEQQAALCRAELQFLDMEDVLSGVSLSGESRHPKTIYAKLFADHLIPADRVLYLDSDTVIQGDISSLWERDMSEELIAGVQMPYAPEIKLQLQLKEKSPYICDGIVLLNLDLWKKHNIRSKCIRHIEKFSGFPPMLSEGTINYVCEGKIGILPPEFNLMPHMLFYRENQIAKLFKAASYYSAEAICTAKKEPKIIHYVNELYNRPWNDPCDHPWKGAYRRIRDELFGPKAYIQRDISFHTKITKLLYRMLPFSIYTALYRWKNHI